MSTLFRSTVATAVLLCSSVASAKDKADKPVSDHTAGVTVAVLKLTAPLALVEYEQSLGDKQSFTIGAGYGRFNSLWLRIINSLGSEVDASYTISQIAATGAYNYYFKHFNRGFYTGLGMQYGMYSPEATAGSEQAALGSFSQLRIGPTIGYKVATESGFTFSWDWGLGYGAVFGDTSGSIAPLISESGVRGLGSMNMGWSF